MAAKRGAASQPAKANNKTIQLINATAERLKNRFSKVDRINVATKKYMPKKSAGILLYRFVNKQLKVLLVHPGGPFWAKKEVGSWSVPKGEFDDNEAPLTAAIRELEEETGIKVSGDFIELSPIKQKSGKTVFAWAIEKDIDVDKINSNSFEMEWPAKSGLLKTFPEVDRAGWFSIADALIKIVGGQVPLIVELKEKLNAGAQVDDKLKA